MNHDELTVIAFNEAINRRDLTALTALMTDDHRFVDSADDVVDGNAACSEPLLVGPARWRVVVRDGLVAEWRVSEI
jgi:hypothetical protein